MSIYEGLEKILDKSNIKYNELMKNHTTTKVGGPCDCLVEPTSIEEIQNILKYAKENNIKYYVIGNGSNLLVKDEGINALIIKITDKFSDYEINDNYIKIPRNICDFMLSNLSNNAIKLYCIIIYLYISLLVIKGNPSSVNS